MKTNNIGHGATAYIILVSVLAFCLMADYVPRLHFLSAWVTPPVVLFLGLTFAMFFGQPFPAFNKKASKKLLQYSVVGLGFGMNLHASLASGS